MTNQLQMQQHLVSPTQTNSTGQQSIRDKGFCSGQSGTKGKEKVDDTGIPSHSDHGSYSSYSYLIGDTKQIVKQYANEILQHYLKAPPPLQLPSEIHYHYHRSAPPPRQLLNNSVHHHQNKLHHPRQYPNEIINLIFDHYLQQQKSPCEFALVSSQFYAIASPSIWQVLNFDNFTINIRHFLACLSDASQQRLETIGQHIRELHLSGFRWWDGQLTRWLPHIPHLHHLSICSSSNISDLSFQHLPQQCQQLSSLEITTERLTDRSFFAIGQHCHQLRTLKWRIEEKQSPALLEMLTPCPLERLQLFSTKVPLNPNIMSIIRKFDHLTYLEIMVSTPAVMQSLLLETMTTTTTTTIGNTSNNHQALGNDNDIHAAVAPTPWPRLTKLILHNCNDIDDKTLVGFIKCLPHLQELSLMQAGLLTGASLDAMAVWLPNLTHLTLTSNARISPDDIRRLLIHKCPCLEYVKLFSCQGWMKDDFPELVDSSKWYDEVVLDQRTIEKIRIGTRG